MLINRITNINSNEFSTAMQIYENSFPANERQSLDTITDRVKSGYEELYCLMNSEELIGFALIKDLCYDNFSLLDYFAISDHHRGSGVGTYFISELINYKKDRKIIIEVEKYNTEINDLKYGRAKFYFRCGFREIVGFDYTMPSIEGGQPEPMCIMLANYDKESISIDVLNQLCGKIYTQIYNAEYLAYIKNLELKYYLKKY